MIVVTQSQTLTYLLSLRLVSGVSLCQLSPTPLGVPQMRTQNRSSWMTSRSTHMCVSTASV